MPDSRDLRSASPRFEMDCSQPGRRRLHRRAMFLGLAVLATACAAKPATAGYSFSTIATFGNGTAGLNPTGGVTLDANGDLFGATSFGGNNGSNGTIFEIPSGTQNLVNLANFNTASGFYPQGELVADAAGNLYGAAAEGGFNNSGTIYQLSAGTHVLTAVASFNANGSNGRAPFDGPIIDSRGNLFGTTYYGGTQNDGTVYEVAAGSSTPTVLASFNSSSGTNPQSRLSMDAAGNLYGTTSAGILGTVFEISATTHALTTLATFNFSNGANPIEGVVLDPAGNIYGTTQGGGPGGQGTVFEIQAGTHTLSTLASFSGSNGANPETLLTLDAAGNLFGTTDGSGTTGTVFEIAAGSRAMTTLASFSTGGGVSALTMDAGGDLYGTSYSGGANNDGFVFKLSSALNTTPASFFSGGTSWNSAGSWNSSTPTSATNATFNLNSNYSIGFVSSAVANDLHIAAGTVGFNLTGQSLNLNGGISVADAAGETANLTITGGSLLSGAASNSFRYGYSYIGDCNNSNGTMTLDGANWTSSASHLDVGGSGTGTLTLKDNANLNLFNGTLALGDFSGGSGTVNLQSGAHIVSLEQVTAGNAGSGHLSISGGASLLSSDGVIAADAGALPSDATVTGTASNWTSTGSIYVGGYQVIAGSQGTLNVNNGGSVNITGTLKIWNSAGTVVNLSSGGTITTGNIDTTSTPAGLNWTGGTLSLTSADVFVQPGAALGQNLTLNSGMTLKDVNAVWVNQSVSSQASTLTVLTGGEVDATYLDAGYNSGATGYVNISGGVVNITGASSTFGNAGYGYLNISNGGTLNSGTVTTGGGGGLGQLAVTGTNSSWNNTGSLTLSSNTPSGGLTIGNGGTVNVAGTLTAGTNGLVYLNAGGTLNVGSLNTSGNPGSFNWTAGTLNITNASFYIDGTGPLGGHLTLGVNQTLNVSGGTGADLLVVGNTQAGSLTVNAGASVDVAYGMIVGSAYSPGPDALSISGAGASVSVAGSISLALNASAQITVGSGGTLTTGTLYIANYANSGIGTLNVNGGTANFTSLALGSSSDSAVATVNVTAGTLNVSGTIIANNSYSEINISGGTVTAGTFNASSAGAFYFTGGQLNVSGGAFIPPLGTVNIGTAGLNKNNSYAITGLAGVPTGPTLNLENGSTASTGNNVLIGLNGGVGTVNVTGSSFQSSGASPLFVGYYRGGNYNASAGTGTLNLTGRGNAAFGYTYIGVDGGAGTATVDGSGSVLTSSQDLNIGYGTLVSNMTSYGSSGVLNVSNGGLVSCVGAAYIGRSGGTGTATITGSGSLFTTYTSSGTLYVGFGNYSNGAYTTPGVGTLIVSAAGAVSVSGNTYIGRNGGAQGTVSVTGSGSSLFGNSQTLELGGFPGDTGTLNVSNGATVSGYQQVNVGNTGTGALNVDGNVGGVASSLTAANLYLGCFGGGGTDRLNVTNGGLVTAPILYDGLNGSVGAATVAGPGSRLNTSTQTYVGYGRWYSGSADYGPAIGSLNVSNGGVVTGGAVDVGHYGGQGTASVSGAGSMIQTARMGVGDGTYNESSAAYVSVGTLSISNGGVIDSGAAFIGYGGAIGTITVDATGGTGSLLSSTSYINIGQLDFSPGNVSQGTLVLTNGGMATAGSSVEVGYQGGSGTVNITTNSMLMAAQLLVGDGRYTPGGSTYGSTGTLNVNGSGQAIGTSQAYVGYEGGSGTANVNGSAGLASLNSSGPLAVGISRFTGDSAGEAGVGALHLSYGGQASGAQSYIGYQGGTGTVTVDGTGSLVQSTSDVFLVGDGRFNQSGFNFPSSGSLTITNGGQAVGYSNFGIGCNGGSGVVTVGSTSGSSYTPVLSAANLTLSQNSGGLNDAGGTLNVYTGGLVQISRNLSIVDAATSQVNLAGGNINAGSISINTASRLNWSSGTLNITNSDLDIGAGESIPSLAISGGQTLMVSGTGHNLNITGLFNMTGGATIVSGNTNLAAAGAFQLSGGNFTSATLTGSAPINWSGGTITLTSPAAAVAVGAGSIFGSVLTLTFAGSQSLWVAGTESVSGAVQHEGGSNTDSVLNISSSGGQGAEYLLFGGTLTSQTELIQGYKGLFVQGGGVNLAGSINIAASSGATNCSYQLNLGTATASAGVFVGGTAAGPGGSGTLSLIGGQLNITGGLTVYSTASTFSIANQGVVVADSVSLYSSGNSVSAGGTLNIGTGGLTLSGSASPGIALTSGTLLLGGELKFNGTIGTATISGTGTMDLGGAANQIFNIAHGSGTVDVNISASIVHGSFIKTGAGILELSGSNTLTSAVQISSGALGLGNPQALGVAGAIVASGAILDLSYDAGATTYIGSLTGAGNVLLGGGNGTLNVGADNSSTNFSGIISGQGSLQKSGTGTLTLSAANSYSGTTTVTGGTLRYGVASAIVPGSDIVVSNGAALDLAGFSPTVGSIAGPGNITLGNGSLTVGLSNENTTFAGSISGSGGIIKQGSGTLTLSNPLLTFSGGLEVADGVVIAAGPTNFAGNVTVTADGPVFGTLQVGTDAELGNAANSVNLTGGMLVATGTFTSTRSFRLGDTAGNGQGFFSVNTGSTLTLNGPVSGLTGLVMQGPGLLVLDGSLSYGGSTQVSGGTLQLGPGVALPSQSVVSVAPGATFSLGGQSRTFSALKDITGAGGSGSISLGSATLTVGSLGASTIFSGNINGSTGGAIVMSGAGSMALTGSLSNFTGGASVTQGTLLLGGSANTFTGGVSASGGTLSVSSDGAMGNASNVISLSSGGTLAVTSSFSTARHLSVGSGSGILEVGTSDTLIDSGVIMGATPLTLSGTAGTAGGGGLLNLTAAESYAGLLTIDGSSPSAGAYDTTLLLSGAATMDALSALSLIRQGTLEVDDASGLTSGRLGASTALNLSGGTLSIVGPNSAMADESLGKIDVLQGTSTLDLIDGSNYGSVDLTFASYTRTPGAQLFIDMSPSDSIYFSSMPTGLISGVTLVEDGMMGHAQYSQTLGVEFFGSTMPADAVTPAFMFNAAPSPVPEPAGMGMVTATVLGLSRRRNRPVPRFKTA